MSVLTSLIAHEVNFWGGGGGEGISGEKKRNSGGNPRVPFPPSVLIPALGCILSMQLIQAGHCYSMKHIVKPNDDSSNI